MSNNLNKLSGYILANKRLLFVFLMVMMLIDRINTFFRFSILYTDSDQTVLWQVSKDLMNGIFHGPCFYGQSYNPIIEPLFSLPFLFLGMEYSTALPLVTTILGVFPFILLSFYFYRRFDPLIATIPLMVSLLLSIEYEMLSSIPRGFVTGIFFATIGFTLIAFHKTLISRFIGGLLIGIGIYVNPNCVLLLPLLLLFSTTIKESFFKMFIPSFLGLSIGASLIVINLWYYGSNPDLVIHGNPNLRLSLSSFLKAVGLMDNYFDFITPVFWRAGWVSLSLFIIVSIRLWKHKFKKESTTIIITFILIVFSFSVSKISDGTNSVFFSGSRMFLTYPIIISFILVFTLKTFSEAKKKIFYTSLFVISIIAFSFKIFAFNALLNHSLRDVAYTVVQVMKVEELQKTCEDMMFFSEEKIDLVLANSPHTQDQIITYGCQCLIDDFPTTIQPLYERRTWLMQNILNDVYRRILIHGKRPGSWSNITTKDLNIVKSDTAQAWILINNNLRTRDLLTKMNFVIE